MDVLIALGIIFAALGIIAVLTTAIVNRKQLSKNRPSFLSIWKLTIMPSILFCSLPFVVIVAILLNMHVNDVIMVYFLYSFCVAYYLASFILVNIVNKKAKIKLRELKSQNTDDSTSVNN